MNTCFLHRVLVGMMVLCATCDMSMAQTAPDLTGRSQNPGQGFQSAPDLTGKSSNAMFTENGKRMRSGMGPDLTGKVQEDRRPLSQNQTTASTSNNTVVSIAGVVVLLGLAGFTAMYLQKGKR